MGKSPRRRGAEKRALGIDVTKTGRLMEVVDGGIVFEEKGETAIIQWAKKPNAHSEF